jgi:hypothetical protein
MAEIWDRRAKIGAREATTARDEGKGWVLGTGALEEDG